MVSESQFSSFIWVDHITHAASCDQCFLLVLLGLGISQEVSECGHVISAIDLMLFIIVLRHYSKFSFGLVFKILEEEVHISYLIIANPLVNAELSVGGICCFIGRAVM